MSHATYPQFQARYPASTLPEAGFTALATHASDLVTATVTAPYDTTDTDIIAAFANATCDQIAAWAETGDSNDLAGYAPGVSMTLGDLTVNGQPARVSPRTVRTLRTAGLLAIYGE
jgi:hypothetical protein